MKRALVPIAAILAILVCTSAFAGNERAMRLDPGTSGNNSSTRSEASSFEQDMRDLRRILVQERAARTVQPGGGRPIEQASLATAELARSQATLSTVEPTLDQLAGVRAQLAGFEDVAAAEAAGYERFGDCMSGPQGGQGIHYRHVGTIVDPALDPVAPELVMYEPRADGTLRLIGAEWIVFQQAWHDAGNASAPVLFGREFSLNTTLLDEPFYALHLWVWHHNPLGLFANWNPLVQCGTAVAEAS